MSCVVIGTLTVIKGLIRALDPQPTYEELAETIAQCVYDKIYLEVSRYYAENGELVIEKIVDNMSSSSFQIPTGS